jgi:uncharacterized protein YggU (UPF0235/DUF167 family)
MASFITVTVRTRSKKPGVDALGGAAYVVRVAAAPEKGRANEEVLRKLADHLGLPSSQLTIVRGGRSPRKLIRVEDGPGSGKPAPAS